MNGVGSRSETTLQEQASVGLEARKKRNRSARKSSVSRHPKDQEAQNWVCRQAFQADQGFRNYLARGTSPSKINPLEKIAQLFFRDKKRFWICCDLWVTPSVTCGFTQDESKILMPHPQICFSNTLNSKVKLKNYSNSFSISKGL